MGNKKKYITLDEGSGGKEMETLIARYGFAPANRGGWQQCDDDAATIDLSALGAKGKRLVFTTDSFTVSPLEFPGGNIGDLAVSGTVNDLVVMGAAPLGLSLSFIIEEGLPTEQLDRILASIKEQAAKAEVPIVTGDTKVMDKGKIDGLVINTSGVGILDENELLAKPLKAGDKVIISGGLGEHAVALLSQRFDYTTSIVTDSKPLVEEMRAIKNYVKVAKDPTRGGIAATLNELARRHGVGMLLDEKLIPAKAEVRKVTEMLGINLYELACEGRLICVAAPENSERVVQELQRFNKDATIIGEIVDTQKTVVIQTYLGQRILPTPSGRIVPRIC